MARPLCEWAVNSNRASVYAGNRAEKALLPKGGGGGI